MVYQIETLVDNDVFITLSNEEIDQNINNVKYLHGAIGVCFNYALHDDMLDNCKEAYETLEELYKSIKIEEAKKGDIISYHHIYEWQKEAVRSNVVHFAIIKKTDGTLKGTIIKSKWGECDVYESTIQDVLDIYGNAILIWRRNKNNDYNSCNINQLQP